MKENEKERKILDTQNINKWINDTNARAERLEAALPRVQMSHLNVEMRKRADGSADAHDEEWWERWGYQELIERGHQVLLHLQAYLLIQEGKGEIVPSAKQEHIGPGMAPVLKLQGSIVEDFGHRGRLLHTRGKGAFQGLLAMAQHHLRLTNRGVL